MEKKGQMQISFGMIFSIIIIVATLAVAGYVLMKFVNTSNNVSCKIFYDDLQEAVDRAWQGDGASRQAFTRAAPQGITFICLGNSSAIVGNAEREMSEQLHFYARDDSNLFFYPPEKEACGGQGVGYTLNHATTPRFFCTQVRDGKVTITLSKSVTDALVTLQK